MRINVNVTRTGFVNSDGTLTFLARTFHPSYKTFTPGLYIVEYSADDVTLREWLLIKKGGSLEAPVSYYYADGNHVKYHSKEQILALISTTDPTDEATLDRLRACLAALALFAAGNYTTLDG